MNELTHRFPGTSRPEMVDPDTAIYSLGRGKYQHSQFLCRRVGTQSLWPRLQVVGLGHYRLQRHLGHTCRLFCDFRSVVRYEADGADKVLVWVCRSSYASHFRAAAEPLGFCLSQLLACSLTRTLQLFDHVGFPSCQRYPRRADTQSCFRLEYVV